MDPAHERGIAGELFDDRAVGGRDVSWVARKRDPSEGTFALAEQRPDVSRNKTGIVECPLAATKACLGAQAVSVVEYLGASVEKRNHPVDVARHALARASDIRVRRVEPQLGGILR